MLVDFGYSTFKGKYDSGFSLTWGAVVRNPNLNAITDSVQVSVTLYDKDEVVVDTGSSSVDFILPGQTGAAANTISYFSNPSLKGVARMQVELSTDRFEDFIGAPGVFIVSGIKNRRDGLGDLVTTATVSSSFLEDLKSTRAVAVYYNGDAIVGGADTFVDKIPAGKKAGLRIDGPSIGR